MIKCAICGKEHELESDTYFTIQGNVFVGASKGLIGNNITENNEVKEQSFCITCLLKLLDTARLEAIESLKEQRVAIDNRLLQLTDLNVTKTKSIELFKID